MLNAWRLMLVLCLTIASTETAFAETLYVSDQLVVSMRADPRDNAETVQYLRTDSPLEVLGKTHEYVHVRNKDGETGYVKAQYLSSSTPKPIVIRRLENERTRLQSQVEDLEVQLKKASVKGEAAQQETYEELRATKQLNEKLQKDLAEANAELTSLRNRYHQLETNAKNVVTITNERNRLKTDNERMHQEMIALEQKRDSLLKTGMIKWFLAGAGVLFIGWVLGKMSRSRRRPSLL